MEVGALLTCRSGISTFILWIMSLYGRTILEKDHNLLRSFQFITCTLWTEKRKRRNFQVDEICHWLLSWAAGGSWSLGRVKGLISSSHPTMGQCEYVIVHTILGGSPVILWISLGGKPKWLPLKFGYHDVMRTSPIQIRGEIFFHDQRCPSKCHRYCERLVLHWKSNLTFLF